MSEKFNPTIVEPASTSNEDFINPLDEVVNEKPYTSAGINASGIDLNTPIPEPSFSPPPITPTSSEKAPPPKREPVNPDMENLSKKDTEMASAYMADLVISGYEQLHVLANKGLQVSEKKLNKLQSQGEINLNAMIDYDYGKTIRAGDFFKEYNQHTSNFLTVSDEFKEEIRPLLIKIFSKRGIGMTDEQMAVFIVAKDVATKTFMFVQQKSVLNTMIESIKAATTAQYAQQAPPPQPQPAQSQSNQSDNPSSKPDEGNSSSGSDGRQYGEPEENDFTNQNTSTVNHSNNGSGVTPVILNPKKSGRPAGRPKKNIV